MTNLFARTFLGVFVFNCLACATSPGRTSGLSDSYSGHGAKSVDAAILAKYAPQPLPPEISRKVNSIIDLRAPGVGMMSGSGEFLFFNWSVTGTSQVWRLDGPRQFPVQMTGGEDESTVVGVSPDGLWIFVERDRNGEENPGLYRQSVYGGPLEIIYQKVETQTMYQGVTKDSRFVFYRANDIKADSYAIYRHNLATQERELIFAGDGDWYVDDLDDARQKLLLGKSTSNVGSEHWELDLKTRVKNPVIGQGEIEEYVVQFSAHADEYLVATPKLGEFRRLYRLRKGKLEALSPEVKSDLASFNIDSPRKHIVYTINDRGYNRTYALNAMNYQPIRLPKFDSAVQIVPGSMSHDGKRFTVSVESSTAPRTSYVYDWQSGKATQWVIPSTPEVDTTKNVAATLETYPTRDGAEIPMFVMRPRSCEKDCPVIVHFHGGPEGQSTPGFWGFAQMLVDAGYVFVEPNVRGSEGYGKTWLHLDDGPKRLNVVTDIEDFALFARAKWSEPGKPLKIGIMGWSYGGYSTLMGMTCFAGAYDAGVAMVGISNFITFLENTAPYRRALRAPEYGDPVKDREALIKLSPSSYLDRIRGPLLIIQGAADPRVPVGESIQIKEALDKKGVKSELIVFADEGHGATKRVNRVYESGHLLRFFNEHLR